MPYSLAVLLMLSGTAASPCGRAAANSAGVCGDAATDGGAAPSEPLPADQMDVDGEKNGVNTASTGCGGGAGTGIAGGVALLSASSGRAHRSSACTAIPVIPAIPGPPRGWLARTVVTGLLGGMGEAAAVEGSGGHCCGVDAGGGGTTTAGCFHALAVAGAGLFSATGLGCGAAGCGDTALPLLLGDAPLCEAGECAGDEVPCRLAWCLNAALSLASASWPLTVGLTGSGVALPRTMRVGIGSALCGFLTTAKAVPFLAPPWSLCAWCFVVSRHSPSLPFLPASLAPSADPFLRTATTVTTRPLPSLLAGDDGGALLAVIGDEDRSGAALTVVGDAGPSSGSSAGGKGSVGDAVSSTSSLAAASFFLRFFSRFLLRRAAASCPHAMYTEVKKQPTLFICTK